jgi:hypothetical protein
MIYFCFVTLLALREQVPTRRAFVTLTRKVISVVSCKPDL